MIKMKWIENYKNSCIEQENIFESFTILTLNLKTCHFLPISIYKSP